jgi:hypothetical protein
MTRAGKMEAKMEANMGRLIQNINSSISDFRASCSEECKPRESFHEMCERLCPTSGDYCATLSAQPALLDTCLEACMTDGNVNNAMQLMQIRLRVLNKTSLP